MGELFRSFQTRKSKQMIKKIDIHGGLKNKGVKTVHINFFIIPFILTQFGSKPVQMVLKTEIF